MNWHDLLTTRRTGKPVAEIKHERTEFQRDYDRMIFSSPFRRLQDKTQVFPLPGSIFVHNRLTHSIEVASVGRSLGNNVARKLSERGELPHEYSEDLSAIVAAACLAHDMGNPPFGHSGEKAISHYFAYGEGKRLLDESNINNLQRSDLINFDGNANSFRLLTHKFNGRRTGGFALTYPTVAAIVKYPKSSDNTKKFGYFQQDKETFVDIMEGLGIRCLDSQKCTYCRHPLVYLVEAADDICYQIMDIEDAHKLHILDYDKTKELLLSFFDKKREAAEFEHMNNAFKEVTDKNEQIAYLRARVIGKLVNLCTNVFVDNSEAIINGEFNKSLIAHLPQFEDNAMKTVATLAINDIYKHQSVVEIEISGFKIIGTLLHEFIQAIDKPDEYYSKLLSQFIPTQFRTPSDASTYNKVLSAVDLVSGMTDIYALDLFKKIKGMGL